MVDGNSFIAYRSPLAIGCWLLAIGCKVQRIKNSQSKKNANGQQPTAKVKRTANVKNANGQQPTAKVKRTANVKNANGQQPTAKVKRMSKANRPGYQYRRSPGYISPL